MKFLILFLFISCGHLFYYPTRTSYSTPENYQDIWLKTKDDKNIHGWLIKKPKNNSLILQCHGNAQNITAHYHSLYWLVEEGFDLLTFDYRGFGLSVGSPTQEGTHLDALAFLEYAQGLGYERLILYGQSLGGAICMRALMDLKEKDKFDMIVIDSSFTSYKKLGMKKLQQHFLTYLFSPISYLLVPNEYGMDKSLKTIKTPLLVIHSEDDPVIPFSFGKEIFKKSVSTNKELFSYPEKGHINVFYVDDGKYKEEILLKLKN